MPSVLNHGPAGLADQCRLQARIDRRRMTWWIPLIFLAGFLVSVLGFSATIIEFKADGEVRLGLFVFGFFTMLFGAAVISWLIGPLMYRPRIVPYFARELGPFNGPTMGAFTRGRGLYRSITALDELGGRLGVRPLSSFGFAYDHYDQQVDWHRAAIGLQTLDALRSALPDDLRASPDLAEDLDTLAAVLRQAEEQGVDFSLIARLHARDSMQAVCTRETRQGAFW
jgi:hypothetical protein